MFHGGSANDHRIGSLVKLYLHALENRLVLPASDAALFGDQLMIADPEGPSLSFVQLGAASTQPARS